MGNLHYDNKTTWLLYRQFYCHTQNTIQIFGLFLALLNYPYVFRGVQTYTLLSSGMTPHVVFQELLTKLSEKLPVSISYCEDKSSMFLCHVGSCLLNYLVSHPKQTQV